MGWALTVAMVAMVAMAAEPAEDWAAALLDALIVADSHQSRTAHLTREMGLRAEDENAIERLSAALRVITSLQSHGMDEIELVQSYLVPALSNDPILRAQATAAARTLTPPPELPEPEISTDTIVFGEVRGVVEALPEARPDQEAEIADEARVTYQSRALRRTDTAPWTVQDGGSSNLALEPARFARRVGDWSGLERIEQARARGLSGGIGMIACGLIGSGIGVGLATVGDRSSGQVIAGASLAVAGSGIAGGGAGILALMFRRQRVLENHYTAESVDQWIWSYNLALREELLLDPIDID